MVSGPAQTEEPESMIVLPDSTVPLDRASGRFLDRDGRPSPRSGRVIDGLKAEGDGSFHVALKMRNLPELMERIARGETIPQAEMAAKYYPLC